MTKSTLIIIGASGHGKVVADIAQLNGYEKIVFLDDNQTLKQCGIYPIVGTCSEIDNFTGEVFVAIGNCRVRQRIMEQYKHRSFPVLIHPRATVAKGVSLKDGTVVMAGAVINPYTKIGQGCIINTCSSVDHDCVLGDFVHVAVGAHLAGNVTVKDKTWIGMGANVINNLSICPNCMIGAGATVVKDICTSGTYIGVPAKLRRNIVL